MFKQLKNTKFIVIHNQEFQHKDTNELHVDTYKKDLAVGYETGVYWHLTVFDIVYNI